MSDEPLSLLYFIDNNELVEFSHSYLIKLFKIEGEFDKCLEYDVTILQDERYQEVSDIVSID